MVEEVGVGWEMEKIYHEKIATIFKRLCACALAMYVNVNLYYAFSLSFSDAQYFLYWNDSKIFNKPYHRHCRLAVFVSRHFAPPHFPLALNSFSYID